MFKASGDQGQASGDRDRRQAQSQSLNPWSLIPDSCPRGYTMSRTIWWEDNQVKMIDQRILPLHYEILSYADYRDVAEAITDMVVRGAPAIGAAGAYGMALAALQSPATDRDGLLIDLAQAKAVLDAARPTAVNLSWATTRIMDLGPASRPRQPRRHPFRHHGRSPSASRTRMWRSIGAWARSAPRSCRRRRTS